MEKKYQLEFLNGLRGWASLIVLFNHTFIAFLEKVNPEFLTPIFTFFRDGHLAVYIFFVLSGFVLSIKSIWDPENTSLGRAAASRYFRLVIPIAATSFLAYLLMRMGWMFNAKAALLTAHSGDANVLLAAFYQFKPTVSSYLSFSFYNTLFDYHEPIYNSNLWTMPYEFAGSMLIYFVLGIFKKENFNRPFQPVILIFAAVLFCIVPSISCFLLGYFLAEIYHRWQYPLKEWKYSSLFWIFLFLVPILIITFFHPLSPIIDIYSKIEDQCVTLYAVMIVASVTFSRPLKIFFSNRISRFLGKISFPLYLVHIIVICSLSSWLLLQLPLLGYGMQKTSYIDAVVTIIVSLCLAYIFLPVETYSILASKQIAKWLLALNFRQNGKLDSPLGSKSQIF